MSAARMLVPTAAGTDNPAQSAGSATRPVVAIVKVARPWFAPAFLVTRKMRDTVPQYASLPGLVHKSYAFARADGAFGGLYLWANRASADAWFSPEWFARVRRTRGVEGEVRLFDVIEVAEAEGSLRGAVEGAFCGLLALGDAATSSREEAVRQRVDSLRGAPGLLRTYGLVATDGRVGTLSEWSSRKAASRALAAAGGTGHTAFLEWFDVPIALSNGPIDALARTPEAR